MRFKNTDLRYLNGSNTFRLGDKYAKLRPGDKVTCRNDENEAVDLIVDFVHVTTLGSALPRFARQNHAIIEAVGVLNAPWSLRKILASAYERELQDHEVVTVVGFVLC